jgi:2,4-dienoyl-CoA reductase-like NADH-dependent reductase (Old Yellow Enzyme family)
MTLESLGSPLALGTRRARNRVLFGPHETNLDHGRSISERHVAYYRRRADGGA